MMTPHANKIILEDPAAKQFLDQWLDSSDFITARTSGSTGAPKSIRLPKQLMLASARSTNRFFGIDSESLLVCPLSANYIAGKMMIVRALAADASLIMMAPTNRPVLSGFDSPIQLLPVVPSQIPAILPQLSLVENLLIGGAAPSRADEEALTALGVNSWVSYGMTETCSHVALRRVSAREYHALPGISFTVDNRNCLVINWSALAAPLVTNDIVDLTDSVTFRWLGRYDNVINSGGVKVFPEEIERQLAAVLPPGLNFYIRSVADNKWGEVPQLVVESPNPSATPNLSPTDLLTMAREALSGAERPQSIVILPRFRRTPNGKLIR